MKKYMKIILIVVGVIAALIIMFIMFLLWAGKQPMVKDGYYNDVKTSAPLEQKYTLEGNYEVSYYEQDANNNQWKKYEIWYPTDVEHTKRNKGQPIIRQMALFPYTIINSLVMRILETTKEEILWSSVLLVICSINGNLPNRFIYLF